MKGFFSLLFFFSAPFILFGQDSASENKRVKNETSEKMIESWEESDKKKVKRAYYLNPDWASFDLFLKSGCLVEGQLMRFNLLTNEFEVKFGSKIKVLEAEKVEYFEFNHNGKIRLFESVNGYGVEHGFRGFFEVIVSGDPGLLERIFLGKNGIPITKLWSNNKKNHKLSQHIRRFLYHDGRIKQVPGDKKKFYSIFNGYEIKAWEYVKKNQLDISDSNDLKELILYLKSEKQL